ncbi:hypothetical protein XELAEV_18005583mg [Xenopus laevis]|uniref:Uncharacterized protein n=1 Tax=Xenopus laevis TaxID=8355 RepID=A0A974DXW9_XENLA|nr:hypothetical protein XELAEV_18005583mg [Xenopus laevis]
MLRNAVEQQTEGHQTFLINVQKISKSRMFNMSVGKCPFYLTLKPPWLLFTRIKLYVYISHRCLNMLFHLSKSLSFDV